MSMENTPVDSGTVDITDDLTAFEADFFGQKQTPSEEATLEDAVDDQIEDAPNPTDAHEADTLDEDEDVPGGELEETPKPEPKKNRFQERIDEVVGKQRDAERRAADLEKRLNDTLQRLESTAPTVKTEASEPTPDDKNEDGTDRYALGEFDPAYLRDLTKHILAEEKAAMKATETKQVEQDRLETERLALQASWETKLTPAQERYPDFQDKAETLVSSLSGIDPAYGEYLSAQIMDLEYGPDVLYYLASNPDEAMKIVNSGARKATVALGRIEAKFVFADEEKQKARPRVSQAPTPPPVNKGAAPARIEVQGDTDDLNAFEKDFFKKRR